jgi:hypothetical protein
LSGIILDGIHKYMYFKVIMFPVYGFRLTIFRPSTRGVVDNFKVTSYNVAGRIIYKYIIDCLDIRRGDYCCHK